MANQAPGVTGRKFVAETNMKLRSAESSFLPVTGAFFPLQCPKLALAQVETPQSAVLGSSTHPIAGLWLLYAGSC